MKALPKIDMLEVTRLTREGRLGEAMAVLRGAPPAGPRSDVARDDGERTAPTLDMVPPARGTNGAWTAPDAEARGRPRPAHILRGLGGLTRKPVSVPVPDGARFEERSYANAAGHRTYKLYVPSGFHGEPLPLVVMLHGCTQSPDDFAAGTRMNALAEEQTFLVAYPAQTKSANASKCWNWFNASDQQRDRGEPALIAGITREILRDFPVARGRVYVAGRSAGGAAAAIMGATYPELYAAVGVHSGLACGAASDLSSALAAMRNGAPRRASRSHPVPTIVFHGDRDTTVNPINGDQVIAQSMATALRSTVTRGQASGGIGYTRTVHADDSGRAMLEQWVLHGAGHAWSGGSPSGSYTEPRGPDASREMMRFFAQHRSADQASR
jgi:poly(hydroxyalkanoate) depolymerase family esterase